jgi:hypothetical protein
MAPKGSEYHLQHDDCITISATESSHSTTRLSRDEVLENGETGNDFSIQWLAHHLAQLTPSGARNIEPAVLLQALKRNMTLRYELRVEPFLRSELVAHCVSGFYKNSTRLTRALLHQLTTEELVPFISPAFEAHVLLLADCWLAASDGDDGSSNLSERCIQSISTYWKSCYYGLATQGNPDYRIFHFIEELPRHVILQLVYQTTANSESMWGTSRVEKNVSCDTNPELPFLKLLRLIRPLLLETSHESAPDDDDILCSSDDEDSLDDVSLDEAIDMEQLHSSLQSLGLDDLWSDDTFSDSM